MKAVFASSAAVAKESTKSSACFPTRNMPVSLHVRATVKLHVCGILAVLESLALATELHKVPDNTSSFLLFEIIHSSLTLERELCSSFMYIQAVIHPQNLFFSPSICFSDNTVNVVKTLLKQQPNPQC